MNGIEKVRVGALPIWGWGLVCSVLIWALYVLTLAPTTGFWDTSEYIATAHILGLPHPPGNPLFVVLGRVWSVMLGWTGLSVAARINLLGATLSAAASFFWFLAVARVVAHYMKDSREVLIASIAAVLIGATAFTVWSQSNLNEKVYTVSLFVVALVSYLALRWKDECDTPRGNRLLLLIALALGLGAANHTMSILPVPALVVFVLWHRWRTALKPAVMAGGIVLYLAGFAVQLLFVPIRSAQNPIIDEADPECASIWEAITPMRVTDRFDNERLAVKCRPLALSLIRDQYGKPPLGERQAPLGAQVANYWQYFDWQWARPLPAGPRAASSMLFLFLALVGLWTHLKGDRKTFAYTGTLLFTLTGLLIYYLNFRYGYSLNPEVTDLTLHEVRERDYFHIIGFQLWGLYAGLGLVMLWRQVGDALAGSETAEHGMLGAGHRKAAPILAIALIPLFANYARADRTGDWAARDWAFNILQSVEPYGVLFTNGDNDTFPLWYLQEVEGIRRDVTVVVHSYLGTPWYPKQIRELTRPCAPGVDPSDSPTTVVCQRPFDAENAVGPYVGMDPTPPTRSIIALDDDQIDNLQQGFVVERDTVFTVTEGVNARVRPGVVYYPDIMVFHIIQQAFGDRPVYFAATAPPVYSKWGLQPHLVRHGLAFKVVEGPIEETEDRRNLEGIMPTSTGTPDWVDRARTNELLWDVFLVDYLETWDEWPEPSTQSSIPTQYYVAYLTLGLADQVLGDTAAAARAYSRAERMLDLSDIGMQ
ncbi:MAG: DUF2723 domain-containing protein [Gemmatimonadota bacterium]|nr:DUF2723 domain-containing protein [Gemmatimonadota bacterium]